MKTMPSFDEVLVQLDPTLRQLEEKQTAYNQKKRKYVLISLGIVITGTLIASLFIPVEACLTIGFIVCLFIIGTLLFPSSELKEYYKNEVVSQLVQIMIENGQYEPEKGIPENLFNRCKHFIRPDRYHSEDLICGKIDKTSFHFAEVHAEERQVRSNGKTTTTSWHTIFKGIMFIADFHKHFEGDTIIMRDSFFNKLNRQRVKLENPEFEKRFDVFSSDQVEARYLLTPSMIERIVKLDDDFEGKLLISFCDSNIMIAIDQRENHFEVPHSGSYNMSILKADYEIITSLISIVNELDLNTRIWSKE